MRALVFLLLVAAATAYTMEKCDLARKLKRAGMHNYHGVPLSDWVCLAFHESSYRTDVVGPPNRDGSKDYGIFQINNKYWCKDGQFASGTGCGVNCRDLFDLQTSIRCAKTIVDSQGIDAWAGWVKGCQGRDTRHYIADCKEL